MIVPIVGSSLTGLTITVNVSVAASSTPSRTVTVMIAGPPLRFAAGVTVMVRFAPDAANDDVRVGHERLIGRRDRDRQARRRGFHVADRERKCRRRAIFVDRLVRDIADRRPSIHQRHGRDAVRWPAPDLLSRSRSRRVRVDRSAGRRRVDRDDDLEERGFGRCRSRPSKRPHFRSRQRPAR